MVDGCPQRMAEVHDDFILRLRVKEPGGKATHPSGGGGLVSGAGPKLLATVPDECDVPGCPACRNSQACEPGHLHGGVIPDDQ